MAKKVYNAMGYRSGMPADGGFGFGTEIIQTCNRGFYGKDAAGKEKYNIQPNWTGDVATVLNGLDKTKPVYFDLEPWLCNATGTEILKQKLYAGLLCEQYKKLNPTGSVQLYGFPSGNVHPDNAPSQIEAWRNGVTKMLSGGELSDLIMNNIDAHSFSAYPSEYTGRDDEMGSFPTQVKYNTLMLNTLKANNPRNLPIFGWLQPRMQHRSDGRRYYLGYDAALANATWILKNCDGMVLFDWDGYGDPAVNEAVTSWSKAITMPWYKGIKDAIANANIVPVVSTMNVNAPNNVTRPFRSPTQ